VRELAQDPDLPPTVEDDCCQYCGRRFPRRRKGRAVKRFCSDRCRMRWHNERRVNVARSLAALVDVLATATEMGRAILEKTPYATKKQPNDPDR